jgi:transposase
MPHAQMIRSQDSTQSRCLYIAFELSNKYWKLVSSDGIKRRQKSVSARDLEALEKEILKAKQCLKLDDKVTIYSCYEAGRDGFWLHRYLQSIGIGNIVVDSSSIEVSRRFRRVKTDKVDAGKLLAMLIRYRNGEQKLWSVLHVPSVGQEDARRIHREIGRLKKERTGHSNRIRSLLVLHGHNVKVGRNFIQDLEYLKQWDGHPLPRNLVDEIRREYGRYELVNEQLKQLSQQQAMVLKDHSKSAQQVRQLMMLKGIGEVGSWNLVHEFFAWRRFKNVKQVGAASGLAPTPYASGDSTIEQGISKAGNRRVRTLMIELSWHWLRYQPGSQLSRWYQRRFGPNGKRMRRVGIVALARKLLVALWKFLEKGVVPEGAIVNV